MIKTIDLFIQIHETEDENNPYKIVTSKTIVNAGIYSDRKKVAPLFSTLSLNSLIIYGGQRFYWKLNPEK